MSKFTDSLQEYPNYKVFLVIFNHDANSEATILCASPAATPLAVDVAALDLRSRQYSFHESLRSVLELFRASQQ